MNLVDYAVADAVATITLNRPPVNALNAPLIADIGEALEAAADNAVRSVVITGSPHFAAGADISGFQAAFDDEGGPDSVSYTHLTLPTNVQQCRSRWSPCH